MTESKLSQVVSSPSRLKIAALLSTRPRTLRELSCITGMSIQGVLKHLARLEELDLLAKTSVSGAGARKAYSLKGFNIGDFSIGDLTVVKLSRNPPVYRERRKSAPELEGLAEETLLLRSRIRSQARRLGRMIDELVANESALRALLDSFHLSDQERIIVQTTFTEETVEDAEKVLSQLGLRDPRKSIEKALAKMRRDH